MNEENMEDLYNFVQFPRHCSPSYGESAGVVFGVDKPDSVMDKICILHGVLDHNETMKLTVRSRKQNGNEKCRLESLVYKTVSFSTPKMIASSNSIAKGYTRNVNDSIIRLDINVWRWLPWPLSPSLGNTGNQTRMPCPPQYSHSDSRRCDLSEFDNQRHSTQEAKHVEDWKDNFIVSQNVVYDLHCNCFSIQVYVIRSDQTHWQVLINQINIFLWSLRSVQIVDQWAENMERHFLLQLWKCILCNREKKRNIYQLCSLWPALNLQQYRLRCVFT